MSEVTLREELGALAEEAVLQVVASDYPLEYFGGKSAVLDQERDQIVTELPTFEGARAALDALPMVQERYGSAPRSEWLALQFVYGFLGDLSEPTFDHAVFESTWEAFWKELSEPEWTWLGLANLQNFRSESILLDLGHGITIRGRSFEELAEMGWSEWHLEQLSRDWFKGANSSHVIVIEHRELKTPDNYAGTDDLAVWRKPENTLLALRIFKDGDIGMSRMGLIRSTSFNLGLDGNTFYFIPGSYAAQSFNPYTLNEPDLSAVLDLYGTLSQYKDMQDMRKKAPVNLTLALQSFSDMYGRPSSRPDTRLVDAITAVEALLGPADTTELSFRLAFRVAAILGKDRNERFEIFDQMKSYYTARSKVVHGSTLSNKLRQRLENQRNLRNWLRLLLLGFLRLGASSEHSFDKTFFERQLDIALVDETIRSQLRMKMGFQENNTSS